MPILAYRGLDTAAVRPQYEKIRRLLEQEDFRAAQVKNLLSHDNYRARLDDAYSHNEESSTMKFEFRRVQNGAVLRVEPEGNDSSEEIVCQKQDGGEIEAFADFLRHLVDHYGPTTRRYSPKRIPILVDPGDKYEPPA